MLDDDEDAAPRFDLRFDPRFQRGYTADKSGSPAERPVTDASEREQNREQNRRQNLGGHATAPRPREPEHVGLGQPDPRRHDPRRHEPEHPGPEPVDLAPLDHEHLDHEHLGPEPLDPSEVVFGPGVGSTVWGSGASGPVWSGRRWLITLWWIGALMLALGVGCLAYGIWANNDTAGQPYQDFWITVFSSVAWQVYGPTMTVGLATLVATGVLQTLVPELRERR